MTETLHTDGDRTVLHMERRFRHPRSRVWRAITEPDHQAKWFPARLTFEPVAGSDVTFDWGEGDGAQVDGQVTEISPERVLAFTWGGEHLRFELADDGDGCRLSFTHTFTDHYGAASFTSGWVQCFVGLEQVLDDDPVTAGDPSAAQHDAYVERFGLDAGVVETVGGERRVRLERQLTVPAEVAWPVIERLAAVSPRAELERDEPKVLAYSTPDGGRVRWELGDGTGHGARLVLTESGPASDPAAWRDRITELARELRD